MMYLRDESAQTNVRAATLRHLVTALTPGHPVPALIPYRQAPGRVATGVSILKSLAWLDLEKDLRLKRQSNPGLPLSGEADTLSQGQRGGQLRDRLSSQHELEVQEIAACLDSKGDWTRLTSCDVNALPPMFPLQWQNPPFPLTPCQPLRFTFHSPPLLPPPPPSTCTSRNIESFSLNLCACILSNNFLARW